MAIVLPLSPAEEALLAELAGRLRIAPAELARAAVTDLLSRQDDAFEEIAERIVQKNAELYRRLA
jgi:hypothetical protein